MIRALACALVLASATPAWSAIAEVGGGSNRTVCNTTASGGDTDLACPYTTNVVAGNALIVWTVHWRGAGAGSPTITDSQGNAYTTRSSGNVDGDLRVTIACAIAGSSGANTVTMDPPNLGNYISVVLDEFSGVASCSTGVDDGITNGTSSTPSSSITTGVANEVIAGVISFDPVLEADTSYTPGGSYTQVGEIETTACGGAGPCVGLSAVFRVATTAQAYTVDWTLGASRTWSIYTTSYRPAGASCRLVGGCLVGGSLVR